MKSTNPIKVKEILMLLLLPAFDDPFLEVSVLDPVEPDPDGVAGISGVSSDEPVGAGEPDGELAGTEALGPFAALHRLSGGVCTLQAAGKARARV